MISLTQTFIDNQKAAVRKVNCKVELYSNSTLLGTYTKDDAIISVEIQRTGDNTKIFGYNVAQRVNIHFRDMNREIAIASNQQVKVFLGFENEFITFPTFTITEVNRNEKSNEISATGYDGLYFLNKYNYNNLALATPTTLAQMGNAIAHLLNSSYNSAEYRNISGSLFNTSYSAAPFGQEDGLKDVLTYICEATATIAFLDYNDHLIFKRLTNGETNRETVGIYRYFDLSCKDNRKFTTVVYEGNQTASATTGETGTTQYIRNNPLLDQRTNLAAILTAIKNQIGGTTINQFSMTWRGNLGLEFGDKIQLIQKDGVYAKSYVLDDTITYNGGLVMKSQWSFDRQNDESSSSTLTITDYLKQDRTQLEKAIEKATDAINGAQGGYITIIDADKDGNPDNIFITDVQIDNNDIVLSGGNYVLSNDTNATQVLRLNKGGLGISQGVKAGTASNGYITAITGAGINASTITTGTLNTGLINFTGDGININNVADLEGKLLYINGQGLYTGTLTAQQLNVGWAGTNYANMGLNTSLTSITIDKNENYNAEITVDSNIPVSNNYVSTDVYRAAAGAVLEASAELQNCFFSTGGYVKIAICQKNGGTITEKASAQSDAGEESLKIKYVCQESGEYLLRITLRGVQALSVISNIIFSQAVTGEMVVNGIIKSTDGLTYFDLNNSKISTNNADITGGEIKIGNNDYYTRIAYGNLEQYLTNGTRTGGLIPVSDGNYYQTLYFDKDNSNGLLLGYFKSNGDWNSIAELTPSGAEKGGVITARSDFFSSIVNERDFNDGQGYKFRTKLGVGSVGYGAYEQTFSTYTLYSSYNMPTSSYPKPDGVNTNTYYGRNTPNKEFYPLTKLIDRAGSVSMRISCTMASYGWQQLTAQFYNADGKAIATENIGSICKTEVKTITNAVINFPNHSVAFKIGIVPDSGYSAYWGGWRSPKVELINQVGSASIELGDNTGTVIARLDVSQPLYTDGARLRLNSANGASNWYELNSDHEIISDQGNVLKFANDGLYYNGLKLAFA